MVFLGYELADVEKELRLYKSVWDKARNGRVDQWDRGPACVALKQNLSFRRSDILPVDSQDLLRGTESAFSMIGDNSI